MDLLHREDLPEHRPSLRSLCTTGRRVYAVVPVPGLACCSMDQVHKASWRCGVDLVSSWQGSHRTTFVRPLSLSEPAEQLFRLGEDRKPARFVHFRGIAWPECPLLANVLPLSLGDDDDECRPRAPEESATLSGSLGSGSFCVKCSDDHCQCKSYEFNASVVHLRSLWKE